MEENLSRKTIVRFVQSLNLFVLFIVNTGILSPKWKLNSLSSTLYKSTTVGLYEKPNKTKSVGGASCPAVIALESATDFFTGQPKKTR